MSDEQRMCTAFAGARCMARGDVVDVAAAVWQGLRAGEAEPILIFDDASAELVELDVRGSLEDVRARLAPQHLPPKGPGRPKLGVVPREVTLLPRHWEWLNSQPGGASVALRKLVDEARKANVEADRRRVAQEAAYRFMSALAGNAPGYEEACRALFAGERAQFAQMIEGWPRDVRDYALALARNAFPDSPQPA